MQEKLPCGDMRKLDETEMQSFLSGGLVNQATDGDFGYLILCDTEAVSREVVEKTDDLPLIIRRHNITNRDISSVTREWYEEENRPAPCKNIILIGTHAAQEKMLFALPFLKLLIRLGLVVKKVHAIYTFKQKHFLADFIQDNIEARKSATCPIKKNAIKCISNSIFGRFLMNVAKYSEDIDIVTNREKFLKLARSPYFKRVVPLNDGHVVVTRHRKYSRVNHPNYIGYYILELPKLRLYDFYYNVLKAHYGDRAKLVYCDTDSLITEIETPDLLTEYSQEPFKSYIDTSNFSPSHSLYSTDNKGKLGFLKSEVGERTISEFVGVKPKCYSILLADGDRLSSPKGVPKFIKKKIAHQRYKDALFQKQTFTFDYQGFTVRNGRMSTVTYPKRGISVVEDKRYYISTLESRSYGHPDNSIGIEEEEQEEEVAQIMTLSNEDNLEEGDERGIIEARLAEVMGGQEVGEMGELEEETYELWGERDVLAEQYFPMIKRVEADDDMLMQAAEQEEINQMLSSSPLEYMLVDTDFSE
ncbi:uncharacterized protein LOC126984249 [Eriocheir sinensis]|uniref:uncharacterized protein LOC126984249 n=1 Tax=Eriocheir sinensis TaxID=95602 RepID=UPI0021C948F6|nr:uncharacterized protein LOC126984249 [Eriocheir sinensis]